MTKVFVSFSHQQGKWVSDRLVPVLKASGVKVLIDTEGFRAGYGIESEMDRTQDQADKQVLVITDAYLQSDYCQRELKRALALDGNFDQGILIPVRLDHCQWPQSIKIPDPLYVDLQDDRKAAPWQKLLDAVTGTLGTTAPDWLAARDAIRQYLDDGRSVNLVTRGQPRWRELLWHLKDKHFDDLIIIYLDAAETEQRPLLINQILDKLGNRGAKLSKDNDRQELQRLLESRSRPVLLAITHFDWVVHRDDYDIELFSSLRHWTKNLRKLILVIQSRRPLDALIPKVISESNFETLLVELGRNP